MSNRYRSRVFVIRGSIHHNKHIKTRQNIISWHVLFSTCSSPRRHWLSTICVIPLLLPNNSVGARFIKVIVLWSSCLAQMLSATEHMNMYTHKTIFYDMYKWMRPHNVYVVNYLCMKYLFLPQIPIFGSHIHKSLLTRLSAFLDTVELIVLYLWCEAIWHKNWTVGLCNIAPLWHCHSVKGISEKQRDRSLKRGIFFTVKCHLSRFDVARLPGDFFFSNFYPGMDK